MKQSNSERACSTEGTPARLRNFSPTLNDLLIDGGSPPLLCSPSEIERRTVGVPMRDGVSLATEIYIPPRLPAPSIAVRTPYGRNVLAATFIALVQRGYVVVTQDCRGTGDSAPDYWDCYVYEREDSFDFVEWIVAQRWFNGFLGGCGGSYLAGTQWCMGLHPQMSTIVPEVGGMGVTAHAARYHMFINAYSKSVGKGAKKIAISYVDLEREMIGETLSTGFFNDPLTTELPGPLCSRYPEMLELAPLHAKQHLWSRYVSLPPSERARVLKEAIGKDEITLEGLETLSTVFGRHISLDAHLYAFADPSDFAKSLRSPALIITGWYDWYLDDTLATWALLVRAAQADIVSRSTLLITPSAHNGSGYHEEAEIHPELARSYRTPEIVDLITCWYNDIKYGVSEAWPRVIYYLMGANEWCAATTWPPQGVSDLFLYIGSNGRLAESQEDSLPDVYYYNPNDPTPTLGGNILSSVYPPGSVDVSSIQRRPDVLVYTTEPLAQDLDVVGPIRMVLYASSSAVDTDFVVRVSDVFPDGRAIQLQSCLLRARFRNGLQEPELLEPGKVYKFDVDVWATANRFKSGHRLRIDIASADFPRFERNSNLGGRTGDPIIAAQSIFHDKQNPSHIVLSVLGHRTGCHPQANGPVCTKSSIPPGNC